jgi:anti-sigma factor RsiW
MDCAELADAAPELALGILPGDERAAALAHLDGCPACRQQVSSLAGVTDQLLLLAPTAQPPAGFEQRVLASLDAGPAAEPMDQVARQRERQRERRRRTSVVAVAALALAACLAVAMVVWRGDASTSPGLAAEQMRTANGAVVGQVFVHQERPAVLFMSLPGWMQQVQTYGGPGETYSLRIERSDGPASVLPVTMGGDASWATTLDFDPRTITSVAMVDSQGRVWCRAQFTPAV